MPASAAVYPGCFHDLCANFIRESIPVERSPRCGPETAVYPRGKIRTSVRFLELRIPQRLCGADVDDCWRTAAGLTGLNGNFDARSNRRSGGEYRSTASEFDSA
jgi:hypothetical protein